MPFALPVLMLFFFLAFPFSVFSLPLPHLISLDREKGPPPKKSWFFFGERDRRFPAAGGSNTVEKTLAFRLWFHLAGYYVIDCCFAVPVGRAFVYRKKVVIYIYIYTYVLFLIAGKLKKILVI